MIPDRRMLSLMLLCMLLMGACQPVMPVEMETPVDSETPPVLATASPTAVQPSLIGHYEYSGYDETGDKIVEGRLSITAIELRRIKSDEVVQISGNWQLEKVGDPEQIGPQVGSGDLAGSIIDGEIFIDLNPNVSDGNVLLRATVDGTRLHGTWSLNGYAGVLNQGTFEATRN